MRERLVRSLQHSFSAFGSSATSVMWAPGRDPSHRNARPSLSVSSRTSSLSANLQGLNFSTIAIIVENMAADKVGYPKICVRSSLSDQHPIHTARLSPFSLTRLINARVRKANSSQPGAAPKPQTSRWHLSRERYKRNQGQKECRHWNGEAGPQRTPSPMRTRRWPKAIQRQDVV